MKQLFATLLLLLSGYMSSAQEDIKLSGIVKPGTRLVYMVDAGGMQYSFTVTVKDLRGTSFDWDMGAPVNKKGAASHSAEALQNGDILYNRFGGGLVKLDDRTTSVWLSQKLAKHFNGSVGKPIPVYAFGPAEEPIEMGTFTDDIPVEIKVDGEAKTINVGLAKVLKKSGDEYIVATSGNAIQYNPELGFPLIIAMSLDFDIRLLEIQTH